MKDSTSTKIIPADLNECGRFISEHRDDIARGLYDIQIEKDWVRELSDPDVLLVARSCPSSRLSIASMTKSTDVLQFLSEDAAGDVREAVADNPKTPAGTLTALARDSVSAVRMAVAANAKTHETSLAELAGDRINYVRWGVAHNESTPPAILKSLTRDPDKHVSDEAKTNPRTPKASWLARLLGKG
jgi:Leucine rich repeat variant